jgi:hypothetical protein
VRLNGVAVMWRHASTRSVCACVCVCVLHAQVEAVVALFVAVCGKRPVFKADGGSNAENLALQNIQVQYSAHTHTEERADGYTYSSRRN